MEKKWIFETFEQWYTYLWKAVKTFVMGFVKIIYSIVVGIVSVIVWVGKLIEAFCRREPIAALIVGLLMVLLILGWVTTFVKGRAETKTAEYQRDSIGYVLDKYIESGLVAEKDSMGHGE